MHGAKNLFFSFRVVWVPETAFSTASTFSVACNFIISQVGVIEMIPHYHLQQISRYYLPVVIFFPDNNSDQVCSCLKIFENLDKVQAPLKI